MADDGEKTEAATPRRRAEAREEGNVARSPDLTAAAMLFGGIVLLHAMGIHVFGAMKVAMESILEPGWTANPTRPDDLYELLWFAVRMLASAAGPIILAIGAIGILMTAGQVGFLFTLKPLMPKLSKLSPAKGLNNFADSRAAMRLAMSLAKVVLIGAVAMALIYSDVEAILHIGELDIVPAFAAACELVYALGLKLAAILLVLAIADYAFQRWKREKDLKMSKQELKEELKRMDGDPLVKQRRARVARQLAMQRIASAVPKADVIVTNPTHFAVALQYESGQMRAPKVVAKGADFMAMRIRQLAAIHGVPIVERKALARALYASVEVGQEIPPEHYTAVAEILAYVYRMADRKTA